MKSMQITLALWSQMYRRKHFIVKVACGSSMQNLNIIRAVWDVTLVTWHQELGWGLGYRRKVADGGILEVFYFEYKALFGCSMSSFEFKNDYNHYTVDFLTPLCPREVALGRKIIILLTYDSRV